MNQSSQVEFLLARLQDPDPQVRRMIAVELGSRADAQSQAVPALIRLLNQEEDNLVRHATVEALGVLGDYRASEVLTECLLEADPDIRSAARKALHTISF